MISGKKALAAAGATIALAAAAPAAANAAITATVTGDTGSPVAITPGLAIRNMDVDATVHVDPADALSFKTVVTTGGSNASNESPCWMPQYTTDDKRNVDYRGNGNYTLTLTLYSDKSCATVKATQTYTWNVAAGVGLGQPAGALLTRQPNSFSTNTHAIDFAGAPGALGYEVKYALGGVPAADGSISGPVQDAYVDSTTGKVQLSLREPGTYMMVARAKAFSGITTPWSAPITINAIAPFDLSSLTFPDARGPSYQLKGTLGTLNAGGKVTVSAAYGKKGKRFRRLGKATVSSKGTFQLRFRMKKYGYYRMRFSYPGTSIVVKGTVTTVVRIRKVIL